MRLRIDPTTAQHSAPRRLQRAARRAVRGTRCAGCLELLCRMPLYCADADTVMAALDQGRPYREAIAAGLHRAALDLAARRPPPPPEIERRLADYLRLTEAVAAGRVPELPPGDLQKCPCADLSWRFRKLVERWNASVETWWG